MDLDVELPCRLCRQGGRQTPEASRMCQLMLSGYVPGRSCELTTGTYVYVLFYMAKAYHWQTTLGRFDELWNHSFAVIRNQNRSEDFTFVSKRTLYNGLNLVGGHVQDTQEWTERLQSQFEWFKELVLQNIVNESNADSVALIFCIAVQGMRMRSSSTHWWISSKLT